MKKFVKIFFTTAFLFAFCTSAWAARPVVSRKQYGNNNLPYSKNAFPAGWKYEAGYTVWRVNRKLPANLNTYRRYRNDRAWHNRMHRYHRPEEILLNTLDWTVEEVALFMQQNQDIFKFHPAGYENDKRLLRE